MKISSLQENLKTGLQTVSHIAGKKANLPILNNILIKADGDGIKLITTDLEIGIICSIRGKIEKTGEYTVDSKIITDYISLLSNQKVDIELSENKLLINGENYKTVIKGTLSDEYPLIPQVEKKYFYKAKTDEFKKALSQIIFAVSNSENRIELTGVFFNFLNEQLTMAATDSFRLAEKTINIDSSNKEKDNLKIIVPAKTLQELIRILATIKNEDLNNENKELKIYISDNQILFTVAGIELVSRLIEGQYPDYKQIIPKNFVTKAIVNKNDLIRAVKTSSIFSKVGINDINLDFPIANDKVVISSASSHAGENITEINSKTEGKDNGVVLNYRFLLDGLNNIDGDNIRVEIIDGNTPCLFKAFKDEDYVYVVMPIKQ